MKKNGSSVKQTEEDDLRPHYDVDYSKSRPNRFARRRKEQVAVLLDKDLSKIFQTPEQVTHALRSLIEAMPTKPVRQARAR